jgi:4-alpha-glucanotransferase
LRGGEAMRPNLHELARRYGVETSYLSETGEYRTVSDKVVRAVLKCLRSGAGVPSRRSDVDRGAVRAQCLVPSWLKTGRCWGLSCQLYALKSKRNLGVGDFADLAELCAIAAAAGADFVGTNPLHALFLADPSRCSPYSPSSRRFLNPIYIAVDQLGRPGSLSDRDRAQGDSLRALTLIDYGRVSRLKLRLLRKAFSARQDDAAFKCFEDQGGETLRDFATFEALSQSMVAHGHGSGWRSWPESFRDNKSGSVRAFVKQHTDDIRFHAWLQWVAASQLVAAQAKALKAGMRIGLYLDLAVGVAPDGAATWSDPSVVVPSAHIGAPPDAFNANGQDWGLAPISPSVLCDTSCRPLFDDLAASMRYAGAVRIDHVMGLQRLYWIPEGFAAQKGCYVRYPLGDMIAAVAACSRQHAAMVIGEDLGTVPEGFRELMARSEIQGYRVLMFERRPDGSFISPDRYPQRALACVGTHDLPTQAAWWSGADLELRRELGMATGPEALPQRTRDRHALIEALSTARLLPPRSHRYGGNFPEQIAVASHRYLAATRCRMIAVQLEDIAGALHQVNVPGTVAEHPNWRRPLTISLAQLPRHRMFRRIVAAMADARPRTQ